MAEPAGCADNPADGLSAWPMRLARLRNGLSPLLGKMASLYITGFVASLCGAFVGFLGGLAIGDLTGALIGCSIVSAISTAVCIAGEVAPWRLIGGFVLGTGVAFGEITGGHIAALAAAATGGILIGLLSAIGKNRHNHPTKHIAYRILLWIFVGLVANVWLLAFQEGISGMEL